MTLLERGNFMLTVDRSVAFKPDDDDSGSGGGSTVDTTHDAAIETYTTTLIETGDSNQAEDARQGTYNDGGSGQGGL